MKITERDKKKTKKHVALIATEHQKISNILRYIKKESESESAWLYGSNAQWTINSMELIDHIRLIYNLSEKEVKKILGE